MAQHPTDDLVAPHGAFLVATAGAGVVCSCVGLARVTSAIREVRRSHVDPSFRGRGLGHRLMLEVEHRPQEIGFGELRLDTRHDLIRATSVIRVPRLCRGAGALGWAILRPLVQQVARVRRDPRRMAVPVCRTARRLGGRSWALPPPMLVAIQCPKGGVPTGPGPGGGTAVTNIGPFDCALPTRLHLAVGSRKSEVVARHTLRDSLGDAAGSLTGREERATWT